ncbi:MAG TPA: hypothetical protein VH307_16615 [Streptosporangiaceae bacterium]|nr:hypothetical protein [Streptosporangiaceae bacterium]
MGVVRAWTDLVQRHRLDAELIARPSGGGREGDRRKLPAFVDQDVRAVVLTFQPRCFVEIVPRKVIAEQVRGLDDVIIDADQDEVVDSQRIYSS